MINKNILLKTRKKLIFFNMIIVGILFLVFSVFIYSYFKGVTYKNIDDNLLLKYEHITKSKGDKYGNGIMNGMQGHMKKYNNSLVEQGYIVYIWKDNEVLNIYKNDLLNYIRPYEFMHNIEEGITSYSHNGYSFREYKVIKGEYTIEIIKSMDTELIMLRQLGETISIAVILAVLISYITSIVITKKSLRPIEASWKNQVEFVQDASHELRTPLTIISSKLEGIMKRPKNNVEDEMLNITIAMKEVRRLRKLVSDLLRLNKEDAIVQINNEKFDIVSLVEETLTSYIDICQIQDKNLEFRYSLRDNIINNDKEKIKQVIVIFLDNAVKYTNTKDSIGIILDEDSSNIRIIIEDSGVGIKEEEINNIFNRFYRSTSVREQNIEGSGVGLSIAKTILSNLNSNVKVSSRLGEGTKFIISIPKK